MTKQEFMLELATIREDVCACGDYDIAYEMAANLLEDEEFAAQARKFIGASDLVGALADRIC